MANLEDREEDFAWGLFALRLSIFVVMFVWTLDKFLNPEHAADVFARFYWIEKLSPEDIFLFGTAQALILLAFITGTFKSFSYFMVFLFHSAWTFAAFPQYLMPFQEGNLFFFASWPMWVGCFLLWSFRDFDTKWVIFKKKSHIP